ncbi:MAG: gliding motility-associated C-terminal domain-containing protein, partial [Nonlabens sp.]|nr:gliding motility-associated C-terminal domain-containing protein [Nonlabens sp.]
FNRWGVLVFETKGYGQNGRVFRGISEGRVNVNQSDELPVGTYFYTFRYVDLNGETQSQAGYIYIQR